MHAINQKRNKSFSCCSLVCDTFGPQMVRVVKAWLNLSVVTSDCCCFSYHVHENKNKEANMCSAQTKCLLMSFTYLPNKQNTKTECMIEKVLQILEHNFAWQLAETAKNKCMFRHMCVYFGKFMWCIHFVSNTFETNKSRYPMLSLLK